MHNFMRHGMGAVRPYLYGDASVAQFITEVLEGKETERLQSPGGFHVEARVGDSMLVLEEREDWLPTRVRQSTYVYVPDVDATFARAVARGCEIISKPEDKPYAERACSLKDRFGNTWYLSTYTGSDAAGAG